jgi:hypothetical protein
VLVSIQKHFIFVHIPKAAGTTVREILAPYCVAPRRNQFRRLLSHLPMTESPDKAWLRIHDTAHWARLKLPRACFDTYLKFAAVRNPYAYAVSYFEYQRTSPDSSRYQKAQNEDFVMFLRRMARKNRLKGITQSTWVCDPSGRVIVDKIIKVERLEQELGEVLNILDIPLPDRLPQNNVIRKAPVSSYYSREAQDLALSLFARDFDLFGYDRALPEP